MRKQVNIHKAAVFSIVINAVQIAAVLAIAALVLFTDIEQGSAIFVEFALCVAAVLAAWGAMVVFPRRWARSASTSRRRCWRKRTASWKT